MHSSFNIYPSITYQNLNCALVTYSPLYPSAYRRHVYSRPCCCFIGGYQLTSLVLHSQRTPWYAAFHGLSTETLLVTPRLADNGSRLALLVPVSWMSLSIYLSKNSDALHATYQATTLLAAFAVGLYASIITYRIFFHPLRNIPGPRLAAVSKFWHSFKLLNLQNQKLLTELHEKYGDIVRTGPNEVVVMRAEAVPAVHGPGSKCRKAPWYDMLQKERSIHATRTPSLHQQRRKIWDQGFGMKALRQYQDRVAGHVDSFSANIRERLGSTRNATELFYFFGFDVMGDTAFGKDFNMLKSNVEHPIVKIMRSGIYVIGRLTPLPWLVTILSSLPGANGDFKRLESYAEDSIMKLSKTDRGGEDVSI